MQTKTAVTTPSTGRRLLGAALFGGLIFILLLAFSNVSLFSSDEGELFYKGFAMAHGKVLYRDLISQHMPLSYLFAALFAGAGVHTVTGFRLCFYAVFALLWAVMYLRYARACSRLAAALCPLLYLGLISTIENGNTVLADQFQALGAAILLFELLIFARSLRVTLATAVYVSLGIFISLMSGFSSAFMIFAAGLFVLSLEIGRAVKERERPLHVLGRLLRTYLPLGLAVLLPIALVLLYLKSRGTLAYFYQYAFRFNTEVYSKYYPNGYGSSFLAGLFAGINPIANSLSFGGFSSQAALRIVSGGFAGLLLLREYRRAGELRTPLFLLLFVIASATRGAFEFHGLPYLAVLAASGACVIADSLADIRRFAESSLLKTLALILVCCTFFSSYLRLFPNIFHVRSETYVRTDSLSYALDVLTEPLEEIGFTSFDHELLLDAQVLTATSFTGSTPWFWEWGRDICLTELQEKLPRVYVYDSSLTVWDYKVSVYAPEIAGFLSEHYVSLKDLGFPKLYVRKDYYAEAAALLSTSSFLTAEALETSLGNVRAGSSFSLEFTAPGDTKISGVTLTLNEITDGGEGLLRLSLQNLTDKTEHTLAETALKDWKEKTPKTLAFPEEALEGGTLYRLSFALFGADGTKISPAEGSSPYGTPFKTRIDDAEQAGLPALSILKARGRIEMLSSRDSRSGSRPHT